MARGSGCVCGRNLRCHRLVASVVSTSPPLRFVVPGKPVAKARARTGHGFAYTPKQTASYEAWVKLCASQEMQSRPLLEGPLRVHIVCSLAIPQSWSKKKQRAAAAGEIKPTTRPDADNVEKAIWDACKGIVWKDDSQVVEWSGVKAYDGMPQVAVTVEALEEA